MSQRSDIASGFCTLHSLYCFIIGESICLGFAYPDRQVEGGQRGGAGDPEPVGFVGLDGEDHRCAMPVAAGGALLGARRVRRRERAVELPPTIDQQRLQQNKNTQCVPLAHKNSDRISAIFNDQTAPDMKDCKKKTTSTMAKCRLNYYQGDQRFRLQCRVIAQYISEHFHLSFGCVKSTYQFSNTTVDAHCV